ncbi:MAG: ATP-dependent zinc metalloprotease FtsH [Bacilli bacterium]
MKKNKNSSYLSYVFLILFMLGIFYFYGILNQKVNTLTYNEFIKELSSGVVEKVEITPRDRASVYEIRGTIKGYDKKETFFVRAPKSDEVIKKIMTYNDKDSFEIKTEIDPESSSILLLLMNILPIVLLVGVAFFFFTKQVNGNNKSMDFGKSKAKLNDEKGLVTFNEVAGLKEEKEEVKELIDFLKNPKKFQRLGARIPKGVLLVGPPGTGKTLLAKAVAGEANVPFYYISGSDFVELFVGVGASRVRDMFKQAKHTAPCLIFIDEIDAVGRQRGTGMGGGHDEREQTLNQLLTEMDGFGQNEGIIIIAATNRADVLDPALLRPGRFDRQVTVNLPDVKGREEILAVHARNKVLGKDVILSNIAKRTPGFSGADLENLLNEAALLAVRRDKNFITMSEVDEATDRVMMGPAKKSKKYSEKERNLVAYHEAGHAVVGIKLDDASDVHKITIIPRGNAGGYNLMLPKEETFLTTKKELIERISGLLAGRVAEEIMFDDITTGAHNDFEQATKIARAMVTEYGMSRLGPVQLEHQSEGVFLGRDYNKSKNFSNEIAHEIDIEMRKIIDECYEVSKDIINKNKDLLKLIADALLEYETLTKEQIEYLVANKVMPEVERLSDLSIQELKDLAKEKGLKGYSKLSKEELMDVLNKE